jgi:hypothetical protein
MQTVLIVIGVLLVIDLCVTAILVLLGVLFVKPLPPPNPDRDRPPHQR